MTIVKFVSLAIMLTLIIVTLKTVSKEFAFFASIAASVILLFAICDYAFDLFYKIKEIFNETNIPSTLLGAVGKVIGLAYLTEFGANLAQDSGEKSISDKIKLFGKLSIFMATLPLLVQFLEMVGKLI